jgi:hypothetical protein
VHTATDKYRNYQETFNFFDRTDSGTRSADAGVTGMRDAGLKARQTDGGGDMCQTRAADDFATIRARMEELRRERERADAAKMDLQSDPPQRPRRNVYWPELEVSARPGRVR